MFLFSVDCLLVGFACFGDFDDLTWVIRVWCFKVVWVLLLYGVWSVWFPLGWISLAGFV